MHLKTLGGLELILPSGKRPFNRPKPLLLLAYLAVEGPKERRHVAELFWPAASHPLDSLRVALSQLRAAAPGVLDESRTPSGGVVTARGPGTNVGTAVKCDANDLLRALAAADRARVRELYTGEFLAGFYLEDMGAELEEWLLGTRDHLATSVQRARVTEAEALAATSALAEAGRLAAGAMSLATEPEPELLTRLHRLLTAADHPFAADVARQAATYGLKLGLTPGEARAELSSRAQRLARHNLPARVAPFVGRDTELVALTNVLTAGSRLVTVTGGGGVGKSRLALQAADTVLRDGLYEDGVFLVELAPLADHRHVLEAAATAIDPNGSSATDHLAATIAEQKILLLFDNFEHVIDAGPDVASLLERCPGLTALVTSRRPLELSGEQLFRLPEFDLPDGTIPVETALTLDAVRLFQSVAQRAHLSFTVDATNCDEVLEICRLVHGLPLGIELAASWSGQLSLSEIIEALRRHSAELPGGPRDAAPRQRSLRATIEHSWRLLSAQERHALTRLAVFTGGFTHEAASRVADASLAVLGSLTARTLLREVEGRYDTHPLVAGFARERLDGDDHVRSATREAHADYYGDLATRAEEGLKGGDQAAWLRLLDAELANLRTAMSHLLAQAESGSSASGHAALVASGAMWQYWLRRGRLAEGRRLADLALAATPENEMPLIRAKALTGAGVLAWRQSDRVGSDAYHLAALEIRRREGDRLGEARSLYNLAASAGRNDELDQAEEYLTVAIGIFRELGDTWSTAFALFNLATLAMRLGRHPEARAHLEERLMLLSSLGDEAGTAETLNELAYLCLHVGEVKAAEDPFEAALAIARRLGDFHEEATALEGLALVAHENGQKSRSRELFAEAVAIHEAHELGQTRAYRHLAALHEPALDQHAEPLA